MRADMIPFFLRMSSMIMFTAVADVLKSCGAFYR